MKNIFLKEESQKSQDSLEERMLKTFKKLEELQRAKRFDGLGEGDMTLDRIGDELYAFKSKYIAIAVMASIINVAVWKFYLKPGGLSTARAFGTFCQWLQKKWSGARKLPLINVNGVMMGGQKWGKLQKDINRVASAATEGNWGYVRKFFGSTADSATGARPGLASKVRFLLIVTKIGGLVHWFTRDGDPDDYKTIHGQREADEKEAKKQSSREEDTTKFIFDLILGWGEMLLMAEAIFYETMIKPYLESSKDPGAQPYAFATVMIASGGLGTLVFNALIKSVMASRRIITAEQASKIFDRCILQAIENSRGARRGAAGVDSFTDDMLKGLDDGVDEVFKNINANSKVAGFIPTGSADEVMDILGSARIGSMEGGFDLQQRIKDSLKKIVNDPNANPQAVFNELVKETTEHISKNAAEADISKAMEYADRLIQASYHGAGMGVDSAMGRIARQNERAARRVKIDTADTVSGMSRSFAEGARDLNATQRAGGGLVPHRAGYTERHLARIQEYDELTQELIKDLRAVDDDFQTYYYLGQLNSKAGVENIPKGPNRPGRGPNNDPSAKDGYFSVTDDQVSNAPWPLGRGGSGRKVSTHWRNNQRAKEEIIRKYQLKVDELNEALRKDEAFNIKPAAPDNVVKIRPDVPDPDVVTELDVKLFEKFTSHAEVEELIGKVFTEVYDDALKSYDEVSESLAKVRTREMRGRVAAQADAVTHGGDAFNPLGVRTHLDEVIDDLDNTIATKTQRLEKLKEQQKRGDWSGPDRDISHYKTRKEIKKLESEISELEASKDIYVGERAAAADDLELDAAKKFFGKGAELESPVLHRDALEELEKKKAEDLLDDLRSDKDLTKKEEAIRRHVYRKVMDADPEDLRNASAPKDKKAVGAADELDDVDDVPFTIDPRTKTQRGVDWFAELSAKQKFAVVAGLTAAGIVIVEAFSQFVGEDLYNKESPAENLPDPMDFVSNTVFTSMFLELLSYSPKEGRYISEKEEKNKRVNVATNNFTTIAVQSGLATSKAGKSTEISEMIRILKEEHLEKNHQAPSAEKIVEGVMEKVLSDNDNFGARVQESRFFQTAFKGLTIELPTEKDPQGIAATARRENINDFSKAVGTMIVMTLLAPGPDGARDRDRDPLVTYLKGEYTNEEQETKEASKIVHLTRRRKKRIILPRLRKYYEKYLPNTKEGHMQDVKENSTLQRQNKNLINGNYSYLSNLVYETLKEYRALDNYNQYPYHSEIGTSEEEHKDFIEDWKDFELSLVRDQTRSSAIELAKVLIKDLELFGDVVDLVGKNQSVASEILRKIKIKQEEK
jgi:hypothetical protein